MKYILLVEIAPTTCSKTDHSVTCPLIEGAPSEICQIEFLEQPWISKTKAVIRNNCTSSQEFAEVPFRNSRENEVVDSSLRAKNDEQGFAEDRDWLAELESQIEVETGARRNFEEDQVPLVKPLDLHKLVDELDGTTSKELEGTPETTTDFTTTPLPLAERISSEESEEANNAQESQDDPEEQKKSRRQRVDPENESSLSSEEVKNDLDKRLIRSADNDSSSESQSKSKESLEESKSKSLDSSEEEEQKNRNRQKRSITPLEKITSEEKPLVRHLADFAASTLDNIDDDNHKRIVLQILGAKKMKMQGTLYHLTMRIGVSRCVEDEYDESCKDNLFENLTKICKVQVHVSEDQFSRRVLKSQCQTIKKDTADINRTTHNRFRRAFGRRTKIPADDPVSER